MPLAPSPVQPRWLQPDLPREGRYVLGPLLGKGGMGEVMEAWDVVLCRAVALKALRNVEPPAMIRFMHEAQIQARVVHPNICRIYDIESSEGTLKIAMQLIRGPNLEQAARQLTRDEAVAIVQQIAGAVHAAHRVNLIHRDLKPSNIILERSPEGHWVPHLCDFGLAVALGEPALTLGHSVLGTPAYMAPEQLRGDREQVSPATDVYSLGGTLHFALLGYPPRHAGGPARLRPGSRTHLPRPLEAILQKCLQEDPARRYASAAALAEDLARYRNGQPILAQAPGRLPRFLPRLPGPGQRLLPLLSVLAFLGIGLAGFQTCRAALWARDEAETRRILVAMQENLASCAVHRALPVHDLRPSRMPLLTEMAALQARRAADPDRAAATIAFALGRYHLLLGNYPEALRELAAAWDRGFTGGEQAECLAQARLGHLLQGGDPLQSGAPVAASLEPPGPFSTLLEQWQSKDFAEAAVSARRVEHGRRFLADPGGLEVFALSALARQRFLAGDLPGAARGYLEAQEAAEKRLATWRSHEALTHAHSRALLGLAETALERGSAGDALLGKLKLDTDQALILDPESPVLLEDWLEARFLSVLALGARGRDPGPDLEKALAFLGARVKEDATPGLKACRMLIQWQAAEEAFRLGRDPGPALQEALRCSGGAPRLNRDYAGDLLVTKARIEASRGQDPRPTLDALIARIQPGNATPSEWTTLEIASEAWLLRAQWEKAAGLDPAKSLATSRQLAGMALAILPASPCANALRGLALALEMGQDPTLAERLAPMARQHLRTALASAGSAHRSRRLTQELARCL